LNKKTAHEYTAKLKADYETKMGEIDNKFENVVNEIKLKLDSSIMDNLNEKIKELKKDQDSAKEEIKHIISTDVIEKMKTQIKIISSKIQNDPLIQKTKLDKCASC